MQLLDGILNLLLWHVLFQSKNFDEAALKFRILDEIALMRAAREALKEAKAESARQQKQASLEGLQQAASQQQQSQSIFGPPTEVSQQPQLETVRI